MLLNIFNINQNMIVHKNFGWFFTGEQITIVTQRKDAHHFFYQPKKDTKKLLKNFIKMELT